MLNTRVSDFFRHLLGAVMLMLFTISLQAAESGQKHIYIVSSKHSTHVEAYIKELQSSIWEEKVIALEINDLSRIDRHNSNDVIICIGPKALSKVIEVDSTTPIISVYNPKNLYEKVVENTNTLHLSTAIFIDPSPTDQMSLVKGLVGHRSLVGVLLSEESASIEPLLVAQADAQGLQLVVERVGKNNRAEQAMQNLLSQNVRAIYAVPDFTVYNPQQPNKVRNMMLQAYKEYVPVIGFSSAFVRSGSIASIVYRPQHIATQTLKVIEEFRTKGRLAKPSYPRNFSIEINKYVARSLNFYQRDPYEMLARIKNNTEFEDESFELVLYEGTGLGDDKKLRIN